MTDKNHDKNENKGEKAEEKKDEIKTEEIKEEKKESRYQQFIKDISNAKKLTHAEEMKKLQDENIDLKNTLQRLAAEFDNYKKRTDKEKADYKAYAERGFIEKLLPILDSFELALKDNKNHEHFRKGVEMIFSQFYSMLEKEGLKPIPSVGEKLDPYKHEALLHDKSDKPDDTITEELSKGYTFKDNVVRTSKVKISKN